MSRPDRIVVVFLDGVGIGPPDERINPFLAARLPTFTALGGGAIPTLAAPRAGGSGGHVFPLDATLGMDGLPQSGTGQAALLTGVDAARVFGGHFGPWIPVRLRPVVRDRSMLKRAVDAGRTVAFANAYPKGWPGPGGSRRIAGPPLAAAGAGLLVRHADALAREDALSSEIVNASWRERFTGDALPEVDPPRAGRTLARIASAHDLTLFAHYTTDTAGHRREMEPAVEALERVDGFLGGLLDAVPARTLVLVVSDHGNVEDVTVGHTRNPALGIAAGTGAEHAAGVRDLREVAPVVLDLLQARDVAGDPSAG